MKRRIGVRLGVRKNKDTLLTLKGRQGRPLRIALCVIAGIFALIVVSKLLKPQVQLRNTAEVKKIVDRGVLIVGVRNDIPRFNGDDDGFEIELARRFAEFMLPENGAEQRVKLVKVSAKTAVTKLSDGTIDAAIALMQRGATGKFAYSYPYYEDDCVIAVKDRNNLTPIEKMRIGFVQNTAGENALKKYIDAHETKIETSIFDKLRGIKKELPPDAVIFDKKAFASYPELFKALETGKIDCAALPRVNADKYSGEYSFFVREDTLGKISYSIAVSADESAVAQLANVFLYELDQSGELEKLLEKYDLKGR